MDQERSGPEGLVIYTPDEAAVTTAADGRRMVFFTVPEADLMIKRVLAADPKEYTYRWAYHPGLRVHVLLFGWPNGEGAGLALEEGRWDGILNQMLGTTDVYITTLPVAGLTGADADSEAVRRVLVGMTVWLPQVKFKPEGD
ncbi:MAG TPA: hypothetical protein VIL07_09320 [Symbiobacteriaceae bacterium]